ncbi:MAG TPA: hypothetical protein VN668_15140 [Stellaceae bacterium]|nr:hypothetical protein [Stellaceae bacterium]
MRIYTVTRGERPLAVVRASDPAEAIDTAVDLYPGNVARSALEVREPNDAEMVGWLERRDDYVMESASAA